MGKELGARRASKEFLPQSWQKIMWGQGGGAGFERHFGRILAKYVKAESNLIPTFLGLVD